MIQKEDLDDMIQNLKFDMDMENSTKRYAIYKAWIRYKYGTLGRRKRIEVHECVRMLIVQRFLPPT